MRKFLDAYRNARLRTKLGLLVLTMLLVVLLACQAALYQYVASATKQQAEKRNL